jgi:hypothetical protein
VNLARDAENMVTYLKSHRLHKVRSLPSPRPSAADIVWTGSGGAIQPYEHIVGRREGEDVGWDGRTEYASGVRRRHCTDDGGTQGEADQGESQDHVCWERVM